MADPSKPTLVSDLVPPGKPNSTMANTHAEIDLIQQAFDAGLTRGQAMTIVVLLNDSKLGEQLALRKRGQIYFPPDGLS